MSLTKDQENNILNKIKEKKQTGVALKELGIKRKDAKSFLLTKEVRREIEKNRPFVFSDRLKSLENDELDDELNFALHRQEVLANKISCLQEEKARRSL